MRSETAKQIERLRSETKRYITELKAEMQRWVLTAIATTIGVVSGVGALVVTLL